MNREIEFRAWLKDQKQMVEVNSIMLKSEIVGIEKIDGVYTAKFLEDIELMQYTGLKDKNSVKIFEGDIVKHVKGNTYKVEFYNGGFKLLRFNVYEGKPVAYHDFEVRRMDEMEVIGNIYENPELLR